MVYVKMVNRAFTIFAPALYRSLCFKARVSAKLKI